MDILEKLKEISLKGEEWKQIKNYSDYYISNKGRVYSKKRNGKLLNPQRPNRSGYYEVYLKDDFGHSQAITIHILVAQAFLKYKPSCVVNHKDENKLNNEIGNLEYISNYENLNYGKAKHHGAFGVIQMDLEGNEIKFFNTQTEAAKSVDGSVGSLNRVLNGKGLTYKGFKWKHAH